MQIIEIPEEQAAVWVWARVPAPVWAEDAAAADEDAWAESRQVELWATAFVRNAVTVNRMKGEFPARRSNVHSVVQP
jgi:hypothetical protein